MARQVHDLWQDDGLVLLIPNIDYAKEYDENGKVIRSRHAGLEFAEYPELKWLFCCILSWEQMDELVKLLGKCKFSAQVIHEPYEL